MFNDTSESNWIDINEKSPKLGFEVDESRPSRWVSMLLVQKNYFEGIALYDKDMNPTVYRIWSDSTFGVWSELQEIPEG